MANIRSREVRLASRPQGLPVPGNFELADVDIGRPSKGQVLVRNLFMSVDPYMRGRMNPGKSYVPPFEIGRALDGGAVGEIVDSEAEGFNKGDVVVSHYGWREYFIAEVRELRKVSPKIESLSVYLGALGMTGMTAWVGLNLVDPKPGEVVFISGAAGAVGSVAGQLAKLRGCRVVGSAGSPEKLRFLREQCGYDVAFSYREGSTLDQLKAAAPDGIDVYFDNVGGSTLEAALAVMRLRGRIAACGSISAYNEKESPPGPRNLFLVVVQRLTIKGFIVSDWLDHLPDFEKEVGGYYLAGKLTHRETVVAGIKHAAEAFIGLFRGENVGKMIVKLA